MEKRWMVKAGHPNLLIFALGWACEPQSVAHIRPAGYDILCLYDYRSPETLSPNEIGPYRTIDLMAWSFGVMMAERILATLPIRRAMALNGTPRPVDDRFGIPIRSFRLTLRGLHTAGTTLFEQRTYGDFYATASGWSSSRSLEEKIKELETLYGLSDQPTQPLWNWHTALIGGRDLIFPPENQRACWQGYRPSVQIVEITDTPHYPFADPETIIGLLNP